MLVGFRGFVVKEDFAVVDFSMEKPMVVMSYVRWRSLFVYSGGVEEREEMQREE